MKISPKPVAEVPGLAPGDEFAFVIRDDEVRFTRAPADDDPFACFAEWASEADRKGYAGL